MLFNAARGNGRRHAENIKKQPFEHTVWRFLCFSRQNRPTDRI